VEFLVEFQVDVPKGTPESDVAGRERAEAAAAADLAREGHLVRLWKPQVASGRGTAVGLYRADSEAQLASLLGALPLNDWMRVTVTRLDPHPNDPTRTSASMGQLPNPRLTPIYRLDATVGRPTRSRPDRAGSSPHCAADGRNLHGSGDHRDARPGCQRRLADSAA
jgi:muconolactone D-isomerase